MEIYGLFTTIVIKIKTSALLLSQCHYIQKDMDHITFTPLSFNFTTSRDFELYVLLPKNSKMYTKYNL